MTKYLILLVILIALYLYWKAQQTKILPPKTDDIIERKGKQKEVFWDAQDFELSDNESTNSDHD